MSTPPESANRAAFEGPESTRPIELPPRVSVAAVVEVCRLSALELLNGQDWGKRELATWLSGPYRALTRFVQRHQRRSERLMHVLAKVAAVRPSGVVRRPLELSEARIFSLLTSSRQDVASTVAGLADPDLGVHFVFDAMGSDRIHRCIDRNGYTGWLPVDLPRLSLSERVTSLIAVDYLARPADYEHKLAVCLECGHAAFDERGGGARRCSQHVRRPVSEVVPRESSDTLEANLTPRASVA